MSPQSSGLCQGTGLTLTVWSSRNVFPCKLKQLQTNKSISQSASVFFWCFYSELKQILGQRWKRFYAAKKRQSQSRWIQLNLVAPEAADWRNANRANWWRSSALASAGRRGEGGSVTHREPLAGVDLDHPSKKVLTVWRDEVRHVENSQLHFLQQIPQVVIVEGQGALKEEKRVRR